MTLHLVTFGSAQEMVAWVAVQGITKTNTQQIWECDHQWYFFYWA